MSKAPTPDPTRIVRASFVAAATDSSQLLPPVQLEVAFAGRSNVGKSSLLNALTGQKRLAHTSSTPGRTRQLTFFQVETADRAALTLVDLPGYGFAKRSKAERAQWGQWVDDYLLTRPTLRAVVLLFDVRRGLQHEEQELMKLLADTSGADRPALSAVLAATKLDTLSLSQQKPRISELQREIGQSIVATSIADGSTIARLWQQVRRAAGVLPVGNL